MNELHCPKCPAVMLSADVDDTRFRICPRCSGAWFDHDELTRCLERYGKAATLDRIAEASRDSTVRSGLVCPACTNRLLQAIVIGGLELDACPGCSGLLLDKGELARVVGRDLARAVDPDTLELVGAGVVSLLEALLRAISSGKLR